MSEPTKVCTVCGCQAPLSGFYKEKRAKDGLTSQCKACHNKRVDQYREANAGKVRESARKWCEANQSKVRGYNQKYQKGNLEKLAKKQAAYVDSNRDKVNALRRARYARAPAAFAEKVRVYRHANPDRTRETLKRSRAKNSEGIRTYNKVRQAVGTPAYVANVMRMTVGDLTPELLELKREQLTTFRLSKQIKSKLKETNEAI